MRVPWFIGPSYKSQSKYITVDEAINVFIEPVELPGHRNDYVLYKRPGYVVFANVDGPLIAQCPSTSPILGIPYEFQLVAYGSLAPYTFSLDSGSLPTGLTLDSDGLIHGTPSALGTFTPVFGVADSNTPPKTSTLSCPMTVDQIHPVVNSGCPTGFTVGVAFSFTLTATGGVLPYTWDITSGALPTGLSLNSSTGEISGTPTVDGAFSWTATVTDALEAEGHIDCTSTVLPAYTFRPDIVFVEYAATRRFQVLTGDDTLLESHLSGGLTGSFTTWADASPPAGTWARLSYEGWNAIGYLTGGDGTTIGYQNNAPTWAAHAVAASPIAGKVTAWDGGTHHFDPKALQSASSATIARDISAANTWTSSEVLPATAVWACFANNGYPLDGGNTAVILPTTGATYIYTRTAVSSGAYQTATCLSGDWRDVQSAQGHSAYVAVGASGGANTIAKLENIASSTVWDAMTPPVNWNPVNPRIAAFDFSISGTATGMFIAISGGPGADQIIYTEFTITAGVYSWTPWATVPNIPSIGGAVWTAIDWDWRGVPGNYILIVGKSTTAPLLIVSGDGDATTWTQRTFAEPPV